MIIRLPSPTADPSERYSMPDPDVLYSAYERVYRSVWHDRGEPKIEDVKSVLALADGYLDLTTYPLGQECCVGKLRDVWRARRLRSKGEP